MPCCRCVSLVNLQKRFTWGKGNGWSITTVMIHQIFSLARDWSKRVPWPNIPQLKRNIREYSSIFETARVAKNIWRIINTTASICLWKYARIFVLGYYLFLEAQSFPQTSLSETVRISEQIMSTDKYLSIFSRQMKAIVYVFALSTTCVFNWCICSYPRAHDLEIKTCLAVYVSVILVAKRLSVF